MKSKKIIFGLVLNFLLHVTIAQENEFSKNAIKTAFAIGINDGMYEIGTGFIYTLGFQKSFGEKEKLRIIPNVTFGNFNSNLVSDTRDSFYVFTSIGVNVNYDVIKYKSVSLFLGSGGFLNYTKGLIGTGGENNIRTSSYFNKFYYGGTASIGLRVNPKKSRISYELKPINMHFGNKEYLLGYFMFGLDYKFKN